jgi:hypothetical protein
MPGTFVDGVRDRLTPRDILMLALGLGLLLRLAIVPLPIFYHADEVWQYMEPAYHLAGGQWVITWEYREAARSWLFPVILAVPHLLGRLLSPETHAHILFQKLLLVGFSLTVIASAVGMGSRISRLHGLLAGFVTAIWFEMVYFAPRAMSDSIVVTLVFPALYLLTAPLERRTRRMMFAGGVLLALACCIRIQMAPPLLVLALFGCGRRIREGWLPFLAGASAALLVDGVIDALAGQVPFHWAMRNFAINIIREKAAEYGALEFHWYAKRLLYIWGFSSIPIAALALIGARRYPAAFAVALANLVVLSVITHKEYRFMLLSTTLLIMLAALGTADVLKWIFRRSTVRSHGLAIVAACLLWVAASGVCAFTSPFLNEWHATEESAPALMAAGKERSACGLAMIDVTKLPNGAYSLYNRDTPMYVFLGSSSHTAARAAGRSFNVVISPLGTGEALRQGYQLRQCLGSRKGRRSVAGYCVYVRPGACATSPEADRALINTVLAGLRY